MDDKSKQIIKGVSNLMKLKYLISITLALVLTVVLSACGQNSDDSQHHSAKYAPKNAIPLSKIQIFKSDEKGKQLTEKEMDEKLKAYLKIGRAHV